MVERQYTYSQDGVKRYKYPPSSANTMSPLSTVGDLLAYVDHEGRENVWSQQYHAAHLYNCPNAPRQSPLPFTSSKELQRYLHSVLLVNDNMNVATVAEIRDSGADVEVIFQTPKFTLHDVLTHSPAALQGCLSKVQFVIYQLLQCQYYLHSQGALLGSITLRDVFVDDQLWISVCPKLSHDFSSVTDEGGADSSQTDIPCTDTADSSISSMTEKWVIGEASNFDYLMHINKCCGRVFGAPNHHPVLPWITDFSQPLGGWRDLSKSKFRLNKGDDQLDQTYEVAQRALQEEYDDEGEQDGPQSVFPHHISDILSDITYYTYKARRTSKEILCQHVRRKWVPHEYPSSIKRLQEWTPDECIPEFYTDPSIFQSVHEDLPDLEIPSWAGSPEDFIEQHMAALESPYVSQHLHDWIDLTFGYKLSGKSAVDAKNVCLELVDGHTAFTDYGVVQLFTVPHPERVCIPTKYISARAPDILYKQRAPQHQPPANSLDTQESLTDSAEFDNVVKAMESLSAEPIHLPPDFDPLQLLDRIEKDPSPHTGSAAKNCNCCECPYHRDTLYLGCLLARIVFPLYTRLLPDPKSLTLEAYVQLVKEVVVKSKHNIPGSIYILLENILEMKDGDSDIKMDKYSEYLPPVTPGLLLSPSVLPFPCYFAALYELISAHLLTSHLRIMKPQVTAEAENQSADEAEQEGSLKDRLRLHSSFISETGVLLQEEGLVLYLPYIKQLLSDQDGNQGVQAAWYLFGQISQILGKTTTRQHFSGLLLELFSRESVSDVRKLKLFHKAFLQQLLQQFGVDHFIENFSQPLVSSLCGTNSADSALPPPASLQSQTSTPMDHGLDLASILTDSVVWLAGRLGPLLTAKYFTSRILQTMKDCYGVPSAFVEQLENTDDLTSTMTTGDLLLLPAIKTLEDIAFLYGEQFILLQYIPSITRVVWSCDNTNVLPTTSASLLSCCTLLLHLIPCLTDSTLLDLLEVRLIGEVLLPLVAVASCPLYTFPYALQPDDGRASRKLLASRILDLIILISQRIGYDHTRRFLRRTLEAFFRSFDIVHEENSTWTRYKEAKSHLDVADSNEFEDIKQSVLDANEYYIGTPVSLASRSPETSTFPEVNKTAVSPEVMAELEQVFTADLAHRAYVQCCRLAGGHYIKELANDDLIRKLCSQHEHDLSQLKRVTQSDVSTGGVYSDSSEESQVLGDKTKTTNWFVPVPKFGASQLDQLSSSPYEGVSGNKLIYIPPGQVESASESSTLLADAESKYHAIAADRLKRSEMETRTLHHLKGDWIAYWEHELGHSRDRSRVFDFKQIGLQVFAGHVGPVKGLHALENENSFVSCGKDKTVKLWTLRNTGGGSTRCNPQFTYAEHKRPVFFASYLESVKQLVSCDGTIHVWDVVTGAQIANYEPSRTVGGVTAMQTINDSLTSHYIIAGTTECTVRFIDVRSDRLAHEFRLTSLPPANLGYIAGMATGPSWIAVAHSTGVISTLDIRTGFRLSCWHCKGVEGELNQIYAYNSKDIITSSSDGVFSVSRHDSSTPLCQTKFSNEQQIHTIRLYDKTILTASPNNRVSTHQLIPYEGRLQSDIGDKLRPDIFKGNLSAMDILPLNRQLLLGSDSGTIHLVA